METLNVNLTGTLESHQPANSIELARNAKGEYSYHIKVRGDDSVELSIRLENWRKMLDSMYPVKVKDAGTPDS